MDGIYFLRCILIVWVCLTTIYKKTEIEIENYLKTTFQNRLDPYVSNKMCTDSVAVMDIRSPAAMVTLGVCVR